MKTLKTYDQFIKQYFNELEIKIPLFYNWDIGLRFDLQKVFKNPVSPSDKKYFKEVYKRALKIFEYCFDPEDKILIVVYKFKWKKNKIKKSNFVFKQITDFYYIEI